MYITSLPGRIVGACSKTVAAKEVFVAGDDGLHTRLYAGTDGIIVTERGSADKTAGYAIKENQILDFSGTAELYNSADTGITVWMLTFDTV